MPIMMATRGPKVGACNICGEHGQLTEDHTPPKGCLRPTQVEIHHISALLSPSSTPPRGRSSQNGVKYRTLCSRCNNSLLGAKYDPAFIEFVNAIGGLLRTSFHVTLATTIRGRPQAILRSLLGHISAQGVDRYLKGPLTSGIRDYFLDESKPLPEELFVYYWAYPHRPHVMARDVAYMDIPSGESSAIWFLKFFPVAFLVSWGRARWIDYKVQEFEPWRSCAFDREVDMPVQLRPTPPAFWPEAPSNRSLLLYGQEAIHAARNAPVPP